MPGFDFSNPQADGVLFYKLLSADSASGGSIDTGATITGAFHMLEIYFLLRTSTAAAVTNCTLTFNGDTGANYDTEQVQGNNATASASNALAGNNLLVEAHGASGQASAASASVMWIPGYAETTFFKSLHLITGNPDSTAGNCFVNHRFDQWRSTSAINQLTLTAPGTDVIKAGSFMLVLGRGPK
jgi:hypothetical protein